MGFRGRVRSRGLVHVARAYLAGAGTTGSLLAVAALVFIVASALVAFRGWPHVAAATPPGRVVISANRGASAGTLAARRLAFVAGAPGAGGVGWRGRCGRCGCRGWRGAGALRGGTRARAATAAAPDDRGAGEHVGAGERSRRVDIVCERVRDSAGAVPAADPGPASPADPLAGDEHARKRRLRHGRPARVDGAADHERRRGRARGSQHPGWRHGQQGRVRGDKDRHRRDPGARWRAARASGASSGRDRLGRRAWDPLGRRTRDPLGRRARDPLGRRARAR